MPILIPRLPVRRNINPVTYLKGFYSEVKRLYNLRTDKNIPDHAVRIDRGTPWGNPFVLHSEKDRDIVCDRFEQEILPTLDLTPLIGKALVCWCYPKRCHGMSILKALNVIEQRIENDEPRMGGFSNQP